MSRRLPRQTREGGTYVQRWRRRVRDTMLIYRDDGQDDDCWSYPHVDSCLLHAEAGELHRLMCLGARELEAECERQRVCEQRARDKARMLYGLEQIG